MILICWGLKPYCGIPYEYARSSEPPLIFATNPLRAVMIELGAIRGKLRLGAAVRHNAAGRWRANDLKKHKEKVS